MRRRAAALALAGFAASGCGASRPSAADQVRTTLAQYAQATRARDVQTICDRLLAPRLVTEVAAQGLPCELVFRRALAAVRNPTLAVRGVEVNGSQALARVHTAATGQVPSDDTILLTKVGDGWRLAKLSQPQPQPVAPVGP